MPRLVLVRHGRAASGWGDHLDPGLDELGRAQAHAAAEALAESGPQPIVMSPLRRTRETAEPLEARWNTQGRIEPAVGEVPSPTPDLTARVEWLRKFMVSTWDIQPPDLQAWRNSLIGALLALPQDTVVFTHFIAINVAVGAATGDARVTCFAPDYCSRNLFETDGERLVLLGAGGEAQTRVL
jgi:broad specificity phosphatase PhoE